MSSAVDTVQHVGKVVAPYAAGFVVGGGCLFLTGGAGSEGCVAAGFATYGGVHGALNCPPGTAIAQCALKEGATQGLLALGGGVAGKALIGIVGKFAGPTLDGLASRAITSLTDRVAGRLAARRAASVAAEAASEAPSASGKTLVHYTDEAGMKGILDSGRLNPSLKSVNPQDARYGNGQYLSDIAPGTKTCAQLSRCFLGQPFQGQRFTNYVEINADGLNVTQGRPNVFVVPGEYPLDLTNRIMSFGAN